MNHIKSSSLLRDISPLSGSPLSFDIFSVSITRSGAANVFILALLLIAIVISILSPRVGTLLTELLFPFLGAWLLLKNAPDQFAPSLAFPSICLFWLWLGSIPILPSYQSSSILDDFDDRQWLIYLIAFTALWCGTLAIKGRTTNAAALRGLSVQWRDGAALLALAALMVVLIFAWASIAAVEGIPIFNPDVDLLRVDLPSRHHIAFQLEIWLSDMLFPLIFLYLWTAPTSRLKKTLYGCSILIAFVLISQGNRGLILPPLLTVFALRHYLRKPWRLRHLLAAGLVLVPAVSVSGYLRSIQHYGPSYALDLAKMGFPLPLQPFSNIYLYIRAPLDTFRNVIKLIPETTPFQHGSLSFGFIEQVLPGRHPSSDFFFKDLLGHAFEGFGEPASLLGTFYGDFGVPGIIAGMFLTGLLSRFIYLRVFTGPIFWLLIYCFFWQELIGSLYGSLFTYVVEITIPLCWIFIIWVLTGRLRYSHCPGEGM